MAQPEIAPVSEVLQMLGIADSATEAQRAKVVSIKGRVENAIRRFLGHNVTRPDSPYVHYLPDRPGCTEYNEFVQSLPNGRVSFSLAENYSDVLQLPQPWLREIVEIREDLAALAGGASIFSSDSLLVADQDFRGDWDSPGWSAAGQIIRIGTGWAAGPRTIRVIYYSGLTAIELDGEYSDIKDVVIEEVVSRFNMAASRSATTGGVGPVKSEMLGHEYSVTYETGDRFVTSGGKLSQDSQEKLERFLNLTF